MDLPASIKVALLAEKLLAAAKTVIVAGPVPVRLDVTVNQGSLEAALQLQGEGRLRLIVRMPPLGSKESDDGLMTGSWQEPAAWLTVNVAVPMRTESVRALFVSLLTAAVPLIGVGEVDTTACVGASNVSDESGRASQGHPGARDKLKEKVPPLPGRLCERGETLGMQSVGEEKSILVIVPVEANGDGPLGLVV